MKKNKLTIIVAPPDEYLDIYDNFNHLFHKYWSDCKYDVVLSTHKSSEVKYKNCIQSDKETTLPGRILKGMEMYKSEYYMFINEDLYLNSKVDNQKFEQLINVMSSNEIEYLKLYPVIKTEKSISMDNFNFREIMESEYYGINLMACVFTEKFALDKLFIDVNETAWDVEDRLCKEVKENSINPIINCYAMENEILDFKHCVSKGKWIRKSIKEIKKSNPEVNFGLREKLSILTEININIKEYLVSKLSVKEIRRIKKYAKKLGVKFVVE